MSLAVGRTNAHGFQMPGGPINVAGGPDGDSQIVNLTDRNLPGVKTNGKTLYDRVPEARVHRAHFDSIRVSIDGEHHHISNLETQCRNRISELKVEWGIQEQTYEKNGFPSKTVDGGVKIIDPDWAKPFQDAIAKEQAKLKELGERKAKLPKDKRNVGDRFAREAKGNWRALQIADFDNGLSVDETNEALIALKNKRREIERMPRDFDEVSAIVKAELQRRISQGALDFQTIVAGNIETLFYPYRSTPQDHALREVGAFSIETEDSVSLMFWLMPELIDRALERLKKETAGQKAMSGAEKAKALKEIDAQILTAHRHREAACRRDEAEGKRVLRPRDIPGEVLLWVERV